MKDQVSTSVNQDPDQSEHASVIREHGSEIQQSKNPTIHSPLHLFTDPAILQQIGTRRLTKFFNGFNGELPLDLVELISAFALQSQDGEPAPDPLPALATDTLHAPRSTPFTALAAVLASPALPGRLRATLSTLETAASAENRQHLDSSIQRRIPCVSLAGCCPLDCALELWFLVPEELSQFQTNGASSSPGAQTGSDEERVQREEAENPSCNQNPASSIEDPKPGSP